MASGKNRLKNYINGKWVASKATKVLDVENPGTGEILAQVPISTPGEVKEAVRAAKDAFPAWRETPPPERARYLFKLKDLMGEHLEDLARILTEEHGKVFAEAEGELRRTIENVEVATGIPSLMQGKISEDIAPGIDEYFIRVPLGVFCVIPPFNFPAMIPFWFLPYALACGDTYIVKPSEQVPLTQTKIFELINEVGFPKGVVNLVHGDKDVANLLIENKDMVGVSSVTSTPVAKQIYKRATENGKRVQCQAGAKNFLVVMPDANLEKAVPNITNSIFGNTGQRCLAGSNVVAVGGVYDKLKKRLIKAASKIKVGYGLDKGVTMGPVISKQAKERILNHIEEGIKEGAELILDGRDVEVKKYPRGHYLGPSIFDEVTPGMMIANEEIFGPVMTILRAKDLDETIAMINGNRYGNGATIYTSNGRAAREFRYRVNCGNIGVNVGLVAPMAFFPFGGMKDSFFGDLHGQSPDVIDFLTDRKVTITRWW